jgi:signal transduction histidine kinase
MQESLFTGIKHCIGFGERDCVNLRALAPYVAGGIPAVVDRFYRELMNDPSARAVFSGGEKQIDRQRGLLSTWLAELFQGTYDESYYRRRSRIGASHALAGLQQQHMFCGMELIWQELDRLIRNTNVAEPVEKLGSLHKLLTLELAIMLDSYMKSYAEGIRESERSAVEEKLTQAQHLAKIGQLAASLAHEIKNPLAGISGAIQIIRETMAPDDPHQPIISEILGQIDRLDATVKDLLLYARPTPPQRTEFPLATIVDRVLKVLREEPALQRICVECDRSPADTTIYADDRQIEQLIINLILNAAQASDHGGIIELVITRNTEDIRLSVKDKGRGMTPEVRRQAFEPFFTTKARGTGLGLSICRRIVEAHGGSIRLESEVARGTAVTVDLPCRLENATEGEQQ